MINKENKIILWSIVIISYWITRLINPLGIKAGDWPNYIIPPKSYSIDSPEVLIKIIYSIGSVLFFHETIFSFFLIILIYVKLFKFYNYYSAPIFTKSVIVLNPIYILFLSFPSKEVILTIIMLSLYNITRKEKNFIFLIEACLYAVIIFYIRNIYIIPFLYLFYLKFGFGRFHFLLFILISFFIFTNFSVELFQGILREITGSFIGYETASTMRWWVNISDYNNPIELSYFFFLGMYTIIFSGLPFEIEQTPSLLPLFLIGFFKLYLIYWLLFKQDLNPDLKKRYLIFIFLIIFTLFPLSIFNIGSAIRYQVPFIVLLTSLYGSEFLIRYKKI